MPELKVAQVTDGTPETFDLTGLTSDELDLIQEGLIELKSSLDRRPDFKHERRLCANIYNVIDSTLIVLKS